MNQKHLTEIKIPHEFMKFAQQAGNKPLAVFVYKCKGIIETNGTIRTIDLISKLCIDFHYSQSRAYALLGKAKQTQLIVDWSGESRNKTLKIASYDQIWSYWGFDCSEQTRQCVNQVTEKVCYESVRGGDFKIFKISIDDFYRGFYEAVAVQEIKFNQQQQLNMQKTITNRVIRLELEKAGQLSKYQKLALKEKIRNCDKELLGLRETVDISCRKVGELMGFDNSFSGWRVEQRLSEKGMCKIIKNKPIQTDMVAFNGIRDILSDSHFIAHDGSVWQNQCNSFVFESSRKKVAVLRTDSPFSLPSLQYC